MQRLATCALLMSVCLVTTAADPAEEAFFESKIRPVLVEHCYECHSAESKDPQGGLLLDTREGIRRGGEMGHGVVPGQLNDSLVLSALKYESLEMPPDKQLPENVIADFEKWIRKGATDPRDGKSAMIRREIDFDRAREFWSFKPIVASSVPEVKDPAWLKNEIDAFVLARLETQGVRPVGDADSAALARRIYFDLVGLPPTAEQLNQFAREFEHNNDAAIESLVNTLLESQHFGERWGRHWLDVVRYAESTGMERNGTFTRAWQYRDYVIDAWNRDLPFDQFIHEQVAGDLLPFEDLDERNRQLIATGMLALGPKSLNETKKEKFQMDVVDEQIDVVTRAFLGLTASCARCHDHKFDPIPQSEYYSLAGIFTSTQTLYGTSKTNGNRNPGKLLAINGENLSTIIPNGGANGSKEEKRYRAQIKSFGKRLANYKKQLNTAKDDAARAQVRKRISEVNDDLRRAKNRLRQATQPKNELADGTMLVMAVTESNSIGNTDLRVRGEPDEHGREIARGFLTIASLESPPNLPDDHSGRAELARWITRETNPLTARVAANRVWQHLFGRGLVSTVNNFGANGDRPSHPKLLDYLATELVADGWSMKQLIRRIMLSRVYRLSCEDDSAALAADPDNHLLWRMNQRRLEAEAIRDAMLMASGQLDLSPQDGSPIQRMGEGIIGRNLNVTGAAEDHVRRSVYLPIVRGQLPEMLALFDFPEPSIIGGARDVTTVPTQALFMMNNRHVLHSAQQMADRVQDLEEDAEARVRQAYRWSLGRSPNEAEVERAVQYVETTRQALTAREQKSDEEAEQIAWAGLCQSLFASAEFRYLN